VKLGFLRGFVLIFLGSVVAGLILSACKADIILPPPRGLTGDYVGTLTIVASDSTQSDRVLFSLRITDPKFPDAGTYSHRFDSLGADSTDFPDLCDMPRGDWTIKNGKLILSPGKVGVGQTCNETLVPTSIVQRAGGAVEEIPFGYRTANNPPPDDPIGDSLIISQDRLADGLSTTFRLVLTALPQ